MQLGPPSCTGPMLRNQRGLKAQSQDMQRWRDRIGVEVSAWVYRTPSGQLVAVYNPSTSANSRDSAQIGRGGEVSWGSFFGTMHTHQTDWVTGLTRDFAVIKAANPGYNVLVSQPNFIRVISTYGDLVETCRVR